MVPGAMSCTPVQATVVVCIAIAKIIWADLAPTLQEIGNAQQANALCKNLRQSGKQPMMGHKVCFSMVCHPSVGV